MYVLSCPEYKHCVLSLFAVSVWQLIYFIILKCHCFLLRCMLFVVYFQQGPLAATSNSRIKQMAWFHLNWFLIKFWFKFSPTGLCFPGTFSRRAWSSSGLQCPRRWVSCHGRQRSLCWSPEMKHIAGFLHILQMSTAPAPGKPRKWLWSNSLSGSALRHRHVLN